MGAPGATVVVETRTIPELVGMIARGEFVIPDFQRDVVWRAPQVADLWDSVFRGFPIGSLLYWNTEERLAALRSIGGFELNNGTTAQQQYGVLRYVLDGQQRLTAFFIAMTGGKAAVKHDSLVDYALYFDPTADEVPTARQRVVASDQDVERAYTSRYFLFASELASRLTDLRKAGVSSKLIIRVENAHVASEPRRRELASEAGLTPPMERNLERLHKTLSEYRVPIACVSNATVRDVCEIYERVNQNGTELSVFDIAVAHTFRASERGASSGFNLREEVARVKGVAKGLARDWGETDNLLALKMIAYCLRVLQDRREIPSGPRVGVDRAGLLNIGADDIAPHWERIADALTRAIEYFISQGIYKPDLLAGEYLPLPICAHLLDHSPSAAEWAEITRWFWRNAFDRPNIKDQSAADHAMREVFDPLRRGETPQLTPLKLRANDLVKARRPDSALYKAAWGFFSCIGPLDYNTGHFVTGDRNHRERRVKGKATRHHIYPVAFLERMTRETGETLDALSVMNISVLSAATNSDIQDESPLQYFATYQKRQDIERIMASHLIPTDNFKRPAFIPQDYRAFLAERARRMIGRLGQELGVTIESD